MREFYQCDFDIAGEHDPILPDAEILRITSEIFEALGWQRKYTIKINHKKILDGIFEVCGVPTEKLKTISSAVDKQDKIFHAQISPKANSGPPLIKIPLPSHPGKKPAAK